MILVDDHLVADRLAAGGGGGIELGAQVATTCSWWWRLCSAVAGSREGALSRHLAALEPLQRSVLGATLASLPSRLVVLDFRELVPAMAALAADHRLNRLAAEAVVVAEILDAEIVVRQDTPAIRATAAARGLVYRVEA